MSTNPDENVTVTAQELIDALNCIQQWAESVKNVLNADRGGIDPISVPPYAQARPLKPGQCPPELPDGVVSG